MNDEMDYKLYVIAELSYKKAHSDINEEELFPIDWYSSNNYKLKTEIIAQALKTNMMIEDTELYNNTREQVK